MSARTEIETAAISRFLQTGFAAGFTPGQIRKAEAKLLEGIVRYVEARFNPLTYVLNLALDFTLVAQKLSEYDLQAKAFRPDMNEAKLFNYYPRSIKISRKANSTLTLGFVVNGKKKSIGIRRVENDVCKLFIACDRTGFTSGYAYNTGKWDGHISLLVDCFKLSESGRYLLTQKLIDFGLERFAVNTFFGRETPRLRLFEGVIKDYKRTAHKREVAGMVMQGIAYGYIKADRPHLSIIADKTRTGSAKQRRFGDIDCYYGLDLEVSVEVKDKGITISNVESELGDFAKDVCRHRVQGMAFVREVDDGAKQWLAARGVIAQDIPTTLSHTRTWDWRKQDAAVHGLLHFLAHVEQKPEAVTRLLKFIRGHDPAHDSLAYLKPDGSEQA